MIKLRILRCVNYLALSEWTQCNHKGPYKRDAEGEHQRIIIEREVGVMQGHEVGNWASL